MSASHITIAENNRELFINYASLYIEYLDQCLVLTLQDYVSDIEKAMRKPTRFGFGKPYWTEERQPTWQEVDDYYTTHGFWRRGADLNTNFEDRKLGIYVILSALIAGDTVELPESTYHKLTSIKVPTTWYRSI